MDTSRPFPTERSLLIVEDDKSFLQRLARAMESARLRGDRPPSPSPTACSRSRRRPPAFAVVDMRLGDGNGLDVISALKKRRPDARGIILTGYGNIATAVTAVKLGAVDYLAKPADADDVVARAAGDRRPQGRAAGKPDVGRPRALGAHPAHLRAVRPQRLGDGAPAQHAPPHPAAHPGQARAEIGADPFRERSTTASRRLGQPVAAAVRVDQRLQPHRGGAREGQHHALARRGVQAMLGRLAHAARRHSRRQR